MISLQTDLEMIVKSAAITCYVQVRLIRISIYIIGIILFVFSTENEKKHDQKNLPYTKRLSEDPQMF